MISRLIKLLGGYTEKQVATYKEKSSTLTGQIDRLSRQSLEEANMWRLREIDYAERCRSLERKVGGYKKCLEDREQKLNALEILNEALDTKLGGNNMVGGKCSTCGYTAEGPKDFHNCIEVLRDKLERYGEYDSVMKAISEPGRLEVSNEIDDFGYEHIEVKRTTPKGVVIEATGETVLQALESLFDQTNEEESTGSWA